MTTHLPDSNNSLVLRTDFADATAWEAIRTAIEEPAGEFRPYVDFVNEQEYDGVTAEQLPSLIRPGSFRAFLFVVDRIALSHPDQPILVVDLFDEPGRTFRVIPSEMWSVENNLSVANMDFAEFADSAGEDGIFRGF